MKHVMDDSSIKQVDDNQCSKPTSKKNEIISGNSKEMKIVYKECLKNHAAAIGAHSTDGCGEFMPSSGEDALLCSACGCHRNFHHKEVDMGGVNHTYLPQCHYTYWCNASNKNVTSKQVLKAGRRPHPSLSLDVGPAVTPSAENEIREEKKAKEVIILNKKKTHRTRFSSEQKEKMLGFVEKIGWKLYKGNEELVQQFCQEIGIKKRVLKVWMHNNKHHFVQKISKTTLNNDHNASNSTNEQINE